MTHLSGPLPDSDATKPMGVVGAGRLTSMIWKTGDDDSGWRYRFNLFRTTRRGSRVSQLFAPADVIHFVKLAQLLAAVIADDGCLDPIERGVLKRLATELDGLWQRTSIRSASDDCTCPSQASKHAKGKQDGDSTHS